MAFSAPALPKQLSSRKIRRIHSRRFLPRSSQLLLTSNFQKVIRDLACPSQPRLTNPLISFLNVRRTDSELEIDCKPCCIPSIENMISQHNIEEQECSMNSIGKAFSEDNMSENALQLRVHYLCLVQRVLRQLRQMQHHTSTSQRRKIVKGTWNILVKFVGDYDNFIFARVGSRAEWGLLELINFDFKPSWRQQFLARCLLRSPRRSPPAPPSISLI